MKIGRIYPHSLNQVMNKMPPINPILIGKNDARPIYHKLQSFLRGQIENNIIKPGEQIPTERKLAEDFGVSVGTVKKALWGLAQQGLLYRIQGRGTFVTETVLRRESLHHFRFKRDFNDDQADLKVRLNGIERIEGRQPHNAYLHLDNHDALYKIERTFLSAGKPVIFNVSFLPEILFQRLEELPVNRFETSTLRQTLEDIYAVTLTYSQKLYSVAQADEKVADMLNVKINQALLFIEMLSFTFKDKPCVYHQSFFLGEQRKIFSEE